MEQQIREELTGSLGNETYQKNYLIEAGAGAGKTFTMVHRIAHQLTTGLCSPENMAVITFTNKATEEMRKRLDDILIKQRDNTSDPDEKLRLDDLIRAVGRMQISTIHSFCKTMLESMPFESGLGMELTYLEDEHSFCKEFFVKRYREDPSLFAGIEIFNVNCRYLDQSFAELCDITDGSIVFIDESSPEMQAQTKSLITLMTALHQTLSQKIAACSPVRDALDDKLQTLFSMTETDFAADPENALQLAALVTFRKLPIEKDILDGLKKRFKDEKTLKEQWGEIQKLWDTAKEKAERPTKELIHSRCMPIMRQLMEEYTQEKSKQHIVSSNDLLVFTRNMLRNCDSARRALHDRYRVLYVDEFQDSATRFAVKSCKDF